MALAFPEASEEPHFEKTSFRVGKKIYATCNSQEDRICLKLSPVDQDVFCSFDKEVVYPVPNKWGKMGWTLFNLKKIRKEMLADALQLSYCEVAPKKLSDLVKNKEKNK